eukprot:CAMPEP_0170191494 /NCGR_PEP_ID=MMETSP0040_2-20121228/51858_1 /TAXON_ID=641309 /ORGANISM="Lotharella oceanica, Strain CCMP622" /LENGTH=166 /DNA_ID=CAMNT_0010439585 /DNA_START=515 /DNA_END=1014 /DNA_ORIENTATION=-
MVDSFPPEMIKDPSGEISKHSTGPFWLVTVVWSNFEILPSAASDEQLLFPLGAEGCYAALLYGRTMFLFPKRVPDGKLVVLHARDHPAVSVYRHALDRPLVAGFKLAHQLDVLLDFQHRQASVLVAEHEVALGVEREHAGGLANTIARNLLRYFTLDTELGYAARV